MGKRHVLFVHGVGTHSRLSSLLQPWQVLRGDTRNAEAAAVDDTNLVRDWELESFDDGAVPPRIKLKYRATSRPQIDSVYFHEVNYSLLAGVVRANHPLDLTDLFVGFDLAVNVARRRLEDECVREPDDALARHASIARTVQRLAGVFVAATVPVLGLPSIVLRQYTRGAVAVFTRFFEDIATFALDTNGQPVIAAHVEKMVKEIVEGKDFEKGADGTPKDDLVIVAHSLGTVVTHSHLVQQSVKKDGQYLPLTVVTFGSPIGLVCWLWLLLDFERMDFSRQRTIDPLRPETRNARYFAWLPLKPHMPPPKQVRWINVVNHLDPIATAFPLEYVNLHLGAQAGLLLKGGSVEQRFINTGDGPAGAHTAYMHDRDTFLALLAEVSGLGTRTPAASAVKRKQAEEHWQSSVKSLRRLALWSWAAGLVLICLYLLPITLATGDLRIMLLALVPFGCPRLTIGTLAFFQRFLYSRPTKRTSGAAIGALPFFDIAACPHFLQQYFFTPSSQREKELATGPGRSRFCKLVFVILSFVPTFAAMLLPLAAVGLLRGWPPAGNLVAEHPQWILLAGIVFLAYVIAFAISEFAAQWRIAIMKTTGCPS